MGLCIVRRMGVSLGEALINHNLLLVVQLLADSRTERQFGPPLN